MLGRSSAFSAGGRPKGRFQLSAAARHASSSSQVNEIAYKAALDAARVSHTEQYFDNEFRFPNAILPIQDMRSIACEAAKTVFTDERDISRALVIIFGVVNLQSAAKVRSSDNAERSTPTNLVYDQLLRQAKAFAQELAKGAQTDDPKLAEWFLLCDSLVARCAVVMSDEIFKNSKAYAIFGRRAIKRGLLNMMLNIAWTGKIAINTDLSTRKLVKAAVENDSARAKGNMQADIEYLGKRRQDTL